jgi:uncharacterized protein (TIGR03083 family)
MRPVQLVGLFPDLHHELMTLLRGLAPQDWNRPTACARWSVQDIVAHLLDTCFRRLSLGRDQTEIAPPRPLSSYGDLVAFLNQLNAEWVIAARRLSPRMLMDLMDWAEPQLHRYLESLDPEEPASFGVAWAGEEHSPNWFDIGREYTERWLHQQQIREAVGAPGLSSRRWLFPVLDLFVRALPFRYRNVPADPEATVQLEITGEAGGSWTLVRTVGGWNLFSGSVSHPLARVTLDQDTAWKLFSKGLSSDQAMRDIRVEGDAGLGQPVLGALAVMA